MCYAFPTNLNNLQSKDYLMDKYKMVKYLWAYNYSKNKSFFRGLIQQM